MSVDCSDIERLIHADHWDPFSILGPHQERIDGQPVVAVRALLPHAATAVIVGNDSRGTRIPMTAIHSTGLFETACPPDFNRVGYRFIVTDHHGRVTEHYDPYSFPPCLTDFDLHVFAEGRDYQAYDKLGAHLRIVNDIPGVNFAVWAPNARRVSIVGDFNGWDGRRHQMRSRGNTGLWELFLPGLEEGTVYKYEIRSRFDDAPFLKADPFGFAAELRPKTASIVTDLSRYTWGDQEWMEQRRIHDPFTAPLSIYEVHLGSWRRVPEDNARWLTYEELATTLIPYVQDLGFTHLELLPVMEHPFDGSWGYQSTGYFAPTSRYGAPEDFMAFVDRCHQAGIGVLMDWTPAHFPDDPHGLAWFDGTHLYDHDDPRRGFHPEWNSRIFNFGRTEVRNFLINSALFWMDKYHIDGLRVDAVASILYLDYARKPGEWIPNRFGGNENLEAVEFLKELNAVVHREHPGVLTIAEESTAWPGVSRPTYVGGLGFSYKWNMGWMHDTLEYFSQDPVYRKHLQKNVTFGLIYAFSENFILVLSHDEVVHGKKSLLDKMPGDEWQRFANLRALFGHMYGHPGKKLMFMGGEFGQWWEWNHDDSLQWHLRDHELHCGLQRFVTDLNRVYRTEPALYQVDVEWTGFQWIDFRDMEQSIIAYVRRAKDPADHIVVAFNFAPVPRYDYRLGVPRAGWYQEKLNSDAVMYGGSNVGNSGGVTAEPIPCHDFPCSVRVTLPPLAVIFLKPA